MNHKETIEESKCFSKCEKDDCKLVHFISIRFLVESKTLIFKKTSLISKLEYYMQLTGLVCLIFNIHFNQLLSILFKYIESKVNHKKCLHSIKTIIRIICVLYFICYFIEKIKNINNQMNTPTKTEVKTYFFESELINLVICVPTEDKNMTFLEKEKATDQGFNDAIDEIYLQFTNKKYKVNWMLRSKVLFRHFYNRLNRCYQVQMNSNEPNCQSQLATSKLIIKYKHFFRLFLLGEKERFNLKTYHLNSEQFCQKDYKKIKQKRKMYGL